MKNNPTKVGFRIRAFRKSRKITKKSLVAECRKRGFPLARQQLAQYELDLVEVPAGLIPIIAQVLEVEITDLLPPIAKPVEAQFAPKPTKARNLAGQKISFYRKKLKWTQYKLAEIFQKMGVPITRCTIANVETQRCALTDRQLLFFAQVLQIPVELLLPSLNGDEF